MLLHDALKRIDYWLTQKLSLTENELEAYKQAASQHHVTLLFELYSQARITEPQYSEIMEHAFLLPSHRFLQIDYTQIDFALINFQEMKKWQIIPLISDTEHILVLYDMSHTEHLNHVKFRCKKPIQFQLISMSLFQQHLMEIEIEHTNAVSVNLEEAKSDELVEFMNLIFSIAIQKNASDIHFEPYEKHLRIRMRINGLLQEIKEIHRSIDQRLASRIKVLAHLNMTERRLPQDGQLQLSYQNQIYHARISTCPTTHGERIVLRILPHEQKRTLHELGMLDEQLTIFLEAISRPQGLILVCGPTGSGKTVTLYSTLAHLNQPEVNILSIEDPVEIQLHGINQVAVNPTIKLTFKRALRSFLRQDPDIIMIGEIRDLETAKIAIKASQTGHLVLSTLHSNSASKALSRLKSMGIPDYDLMDSVTLLVAQRLLRKLCEHCKIQFHPTPDLLKRFQLDSSQILYQQVGCHYCQEGYAGRFAIYEMFQLPDRLILSLFDAAIHAFKAGLTTLEEVKRVVM